MLSEARKLTTYTQSEGVHGYIWFLGFSFRPISLSIPPFARSENDSSEVSELEFICKVIRTVIHLGVCGLQTTCSYTLVHISVPLHAFLPSFYPWGFIHSFSSTKTFYSLKTFWPSFCLLLFRLIFTANHEYELIKWLILYFGLVLEHIFQIIPRKH